MTCACEKVLIKLPKQASSTHGALYAFHDGTMIAFSAFHAHTSGVSSMMNEFSAVMLALSKLLLNAHIAAKFFAHVSDWPEGWPLRLSRLRMNLKAHPDGTTFLATVCAYCSLPAVQIDTDLKWEKQNERNWSIPGRLNAAKSNCSILKSAAPKKCCSLRGTECTSVPSISKNKWKLERAAELPTGGTTRWDLLSVDLSFLEPQLVCPFLFNAGAEPLESRSLFGDPCTVHSAVFWLSQRKENKAREDEARTSKMWY